MSQGPAWVATLGEIWASVNQRCSTHNLQWKHAQERAYILPERAAFSPTSRCYSRPVEEIIFPHKKGICLISVLWSLVCCVQPVPLFKSCSNISSFPYPLCSLQKQQRAGSEHAGDIANIIFPPFHLFIIMKILSLDVLCRFFWCLN